MRLLVNVLAPLWLVRNHCAGLCCVRGMDTGCDHGDVCLLLLFYLVVRCHRVPGEWSSFVRGLSRSPAFRSALSAES